ncbi:hypothetical protein PAXRUDRAFT_832283 [Paxillus rubicundulus Ve08.2h10]|uniref:Pal1-domain-containing protein n=1 Tax=Paxillus rubicundulus Ve08.2h10 TaxID=930991 RepID=A0A0D0D2N8_9AGAM|nr:hypothetical protein PAXRUDRAFT_832283 [Paxillus rubicundulus Ve08.2h10]
MARPQTAGGSTNKHMQAPQNPQISKYRTRHRSYSDPFSDPNHQSKPVPRLPPDPPPKYPPYSKMATTNKHPLHRDNIIDSVRDTVHLRPSEQSSRNRTGRTQTSALQSASASRPTHGRRSMSQDSVLHAANALDKAKGKPRGKKGSVHADIIDRLDFSGVGPMFHHDGPFDACAPSRNRHRTKAPMLAWSGNPNDEVVLLSNDSSYPSPDVYKGFSPTYVTPKKKVDAIAEAWGIHEPEPYEEFFAGGGTAGRDGETPSNSIYGGREGHSSRNGTPQHSIGKRSKDGRDLREVYREYLDEDMRQLHAQDKDRTDRENRHLRRGALPPPQPILVPEAHHSDVESGPGSPSGVPKRTKSLMQRIRKMRDSPNVPVGYDNGEKPPSPSMADHYQPVPRPTHRSQNSFLGRFAGGNGPSGDRRGNTKENTSPTPDDSETYVYIDDPRREKRLPATPYAQATDRTPSGEDKGYPEGTPGSPGSGGGLGRKTSLLKKVKDVVRGPK